ncbi:hypothetical protein GCM10023322_82740 [Rugosimonospora acidiphila]|uniref:Uncharacterized protein n=1 Tax=Rugosimonospora acidiphila TaxID=556531 RepID=A0ABP9STQ3_9ACTN
MAAPPPGAVAPAARATARRPGEPLRRGTGEQVGFPGEQVGFPGEPAGYGSGERPALRPGDGGEEPPERAGRIVGFGSLPRLSRSRQILVLAVAVVVLLGVLPVILFARGAGADPVVKNLDSLSLPAWASVQHVDASSGSRWCLKTCRLRERTWRSSKSANETDPVFEAALSKAGWVREQSSGCPKPGTGSYTCWQRDQYALDLWTRNAACDLSGVAPSPGAPVPSPSPTLPGDLIPTATASGPPPTCPGALVTAKVVNQVDKNWHG